MVVPLASTADGRGRGGVFRDTTHTRIQHVWATFGSTLLFHLCYWLSVFSLFCTCTRMHSCPCILSAYLMRGFISSTAMILFEHVRMCPCSREVIPGRCAVGSFAIGVWLKRARLTRLNLPLPHYSFAQRIRFVCALRPPPATRGFPPSQGSLEQRCYTVGTARASEGVLDVGCPA